MICQITCVITKVQTVSTQTWGKERNPGWSIDWFKIVKVEIKTHSPTGYTSNWGWRCVITKVQAVSTHTRGKERNPGWPIEGF